MTLELADIIGSHVTQICAQIREEEERMIAEAIEVARSQGCGVTLNVYPPEMKVRYEGNTVIVSAQHYIGTLTDPTVSIDHVDINYHREEPR